MSRACSAAQFLHNRQTDSFCSEQPRVWPHVILYIKHSDQRRWHGIWYGNVRFAFGLFGLIVWFRNGIYYNRRFIFQNRVLLIYSFSLRQQHFLQNLPNLQEGWGQLVMCSSFRTAVSQPIQRREAQSLSSDVIYSILLYSHFIPIQAVVVPNSAIFKPYMGMSVKG